MDHSIFHSLQTGIRIEAVGIKKLFFIELVVLFFLVGCQKLEEPTTLYVMPDINGGKSALTETIEVLTENEVMEAYLNAMRNNRRVTFRYDMYLGVSGYSEIRFLYEVLSGYSSTTNEQHRIEHFTVLDMNDDGVLEVVLEVVPSYDKWILSYVNSDILCYEVVKRGVSNLKEDGTYSWSNGAGNWGIGRITEFASGSYEGETLGRLNFDGFQEHYYMNEKEVSKDAYYSFYSEQEQKEEAEWHIFSGDSLLADFTAAWNRHRESA